MGFADKVYKEMIKHAPTILSVAGGIGAVAAVVLSTDSALRAKMALEDAKPDISKADKALIYVDAYAPTVLMTAATLVCIFGSNHVNQRRIAGIAGAYVLKETALKEYKDKAEDILSKGKVQKIRDEILQDHISDNPPTKSNTIANVYQDPTGLGLWYDQLSGRYFHSNAERIRKAALEANQMLLKNGYVSVNDFYSLIGLPDIKLGYDLGWESSRNDEVMIDLDSFLTDSDIPVGSINMEPRPNSAWFSEV